MSEPKIGGPAAQAYQSEREEAGRKARGEPGWLERMLADPHFKDLYESNLKHEADLAAATHRAEQAEAQAAAMLEALEAIVSRTGPWESRAGFMRELAHATIANTPARAKQLLAVVEAARWVIEHDDRATSGLALKPYEGRDVRQCLRDALAALDGAKGA